jgi:SAM-dependent methyltransferase
MIVRTNKFSCWVPIDSNFSKAQSSFEDIYSQCSFSIASSASLMERKNKGISKDLTYGELTDIYPLVTIFDILRNDYALLTEDCRDNLKFCDLGSGSGRPVIAAALIFPFSCVVGIELLEGLYELSMEALQKFRSMYETAGHRTHFFLGSITDLSVHNWTDSDIVFCNSTCFSGELLEQVSHIASSMKKGSVFISLTFSLCDSAGFNLLEIHRLPTSW